MEEDLYEIFTEFLNYINKPVPIDEFPNYSIDRFGTVYNSKNEIVKPYHYDGQYDSVYLKDDHHYKKMDIHVLVSKTINRDYFEGCVVHHRDENKYNNEASNLIAETKSEHARHHADPTAVLKYIKENGPSNKGMKMSDEFRKRCSEAAKLRWQRGDYDHLTKAFHGNQYVDKDGNSI